MTKQIDRFLVQKSRLSSVRICWNNNSRSDTSSAFSGWFQLTAWGWGKLLLVWKVSSLTCRSRGCSFFVIILNICINSSTQFCYHIITPLKRTNLIGYSFKSKTWRPVWKSSKSHCHWLQEVHWLGVLNKFSASPIEMINTICFFDHHLSDTRNCMMFYCSKFPPDPHSVQCHWCLFFRVFLSYSNLFLNVTKTWWLLCVFSCSTSQSGYQLVPATAALASTAQGNNLPPGLPAPGGTHGAPPGMTAPPANTPVEQPRGPICFYWQNQCAPGCHVCVLIVYQARTYINDKSH